MTQLARLFLFMCILGTTGSPAAAQPDVLYRDQQFQDSLSFQCNDTLCTAVFPAAFSTSRHVKLSYVSCRLFVFGSTSLSGIRLYRVSTDGVHRVTAASHLDFRIISATSTSSTYNVAHQ